MKLLVDSVLVIVVVDLLSFLNGDVDQFDVVKQRPVFRFVPIVDRADVPDV